MADDRRWGTVLLWFRRDLRVSDHPALVDAVSHAESVVPVFVIERRLMDAAPARADGPERIACEWWRERGRPRDYYRVEDTQGRRFWLYREGLYWDDGNDRAGAPPPVWYLHGIFA